MRNYELSKFLYFMFYKNYGAVDWSAFENQYITDTNMVVDEFNDFRKMVTEEMISLFQKSLVSDEFEQVKSMRSKWLMFLNRFSKLESQFEDKYKFLINNKAFFDGDCEGLKEFLAEYFAYEKMQNVYESLLSLDSQFDSYEKMIQFYKSQTANFQPQSV